MAKFDAATAVEALEWDFTSYGGGKGIVQEPSTGAVNSFFTSMRSLAQEVRGLQQFAQDSAVEEMTDEKMMEQIGTMDEAAAKVSDFQQRTIENLAILCGARWVGLDSATVVEGSPRVLDGGSPTFEDLDTLPFRVLQAFSSWLMEQIKPKRTTPGTKR